MVTTLSIRSAKCYALWLIILCYDIHLLKVEHTNGFVVDAWLHPVPYGKWSSSWFYSSQTCSLFSETRFSYIKTSSATTTCGKKLRYESHSSLNNNKPQTSLNDLDTFPNTTSGSKSSSLSREVSSQQVAPPKAQGRVSSSASSSKVSLRMPLLSLSSSTSSSTAKAATSKKKNLKTFPRYLEVECWKRDDVRGLEPVLQAVSEACKQISRIVQRAQTDELYGVAEVPGGGSGGNENVQGEIQQKLDVLCNTIMLRTFCGSSRDIIQLIASEEEDSPRCCSDVMNDSVFATGDFLAVFDPIDGSKNIDASLPVGTIFGIYKKPPGSSRISPRSLVNGNQNPDTSESLVKPFLQDGSALAAAGYCLYSATTVLVLTLGSGVDGFTLDPDNGQFLHTHKDIRIPSAGSIYSFNEANFHDYEEPVKRYLDALKEGSSSVGIRSNARYVGALVADVHNILINGGIYGYPSSRQNPEGKLRLLYESAPMAMIMEQAGGAGSTGKFGRILNYMPKHIHQRVPTFLGSIENVYELDQFYKYYDVVKS